MHNFERPQSDAHKLPCAYLYTLDASLVLVGETWTLRQAITKNLKPLLTDGGQETMGSPICLQAAVR